MARRCFELSWTLHMQCYTISNIRPPQVIARGDFQDILLGRSKRKTSEGLVFGPIRAFGTSSTNKIGRGDGVSDETGR